MRALQSPGQPLPHGLTRRRLHTHLPRIRTTRTSTPQTDPVAVTAPTSDAFVWEKHWWPVHLETSLKPDRPNRLQLLGGWFVLWRVGDGEWQAASDRCPHRLAPLSEGRVESDGTLACAYHGWRFEEDGSCASVPQADGEEARRNACSASKSRLQKFPCKAYGNVIWVWPDSAPTAFIDAHAEPIPMFTDLAAAMEERAKYGLPAGFTRVLPYSYDVLVENVSDPAHLPVAHHGIPGLDRTKAASLNMKPDEPLDTLHKHQVIGSWTYNAIGDLGDWAHVEIAPACTAYRSGKSRDGKEWLGQFLLHTPLEPGKSRAFVFFATDKVVEGSARSLPFILKWIPWIICAGTNRIFDMDLVFLRAQDQYLNSVTTNESGDARQGRTNIQQYFLPSSSDSTTVGFRKWFAGKGGGGPTYLQSNGKIDISDTPRDVLLDRYKHHTSDCALCSRGLKLMTRISLGAQIVGAVCFLGLSSVIGSHTSWKYSVPWILGIAASISAKRIAEDQSRQFTYVEFYHADN